MCSLVLGRLRSVKSESGPNHRTMRSLLINKILSFQYRLGKIIGRKWAGRICIVLERIFTVIFGREVYDGER